MKGIDISVVLVGLNTKQFVVNCLESLQRSNWGSYTYEIIYVDNGSKDDSLEVIRRDFPEVQVLANERNVHFCPAGNQGAKLSRGRYILQLNNDTVVEPDAIRRIAEFLDREPRAAVAGGRLLNPDGTDQWSARRFPAWYNGILGRRSLLSKLFPDSRVVRDYLYKDRMVAGEPFVVDWTATVCSLIRREDFFSVGMLPEDYYYWHESVFCHRLESRGRQSWIVPAARVTHFEGNGGGPRPYRVRRWHILDFSRGAYRFHCERFNLGVWNPSRWFTALLLSTRAAVLLAANWLQSQGERRAG